jgi:hypothetical protein
MGLASGLVSLEATYLGDSNNIGSNTSTTVTVKPVTPTLLISCVANAKNSWTCMATLGHYYGPVGGENLTWSQASGAGLVTFASSECTLASTGTCSVLVTGTYRGGVRIEATYSGDLDNLPVNGFRNLRVV